MAKKKPEQSKPICLKCQHFRLRRLRNPINFAVYKCGEHDYLFGLMVDVYSMESSKERGTVACPTSCVSFKGSEFK